MRTFEIKINITDAEWLAMEDFAVCDLKWMVDNERNLLQRQRLIKKLWHKMNKEIYKTKKFKGL